MYMMIPRIDEVTIKPTGVTLNRCDSKHAGDNGQHRVVRSEPLQ